MVRGVFLARGFRGLASVEVSMVILGFGGMISYFTRACSLKNLETCGACLRDLIARTGLKVVSLS